MTRKTSLTLQKLKEALGKNDDQPKPDTDEALHFIDENDEQVPVFDNEQVQNSGKVEPIDPTIYKSVIHDNQGIAVPKSLTQDELENQFKLIMNAPTDMTMTMHRARFKTVSLQILVSLMKPQTEDKTSTEIRFWWNVDRYYDNETLTEQVLLHKLLPVCSPRTMTQRLFM